ncbi:MAG: phytanoyl-CoA dioxygenase family protein, partial [Planctomycetaceae bacterium]|nr:phytanoyl-CoA dioxygenase family protein [Planctomycetaceae bacterium]
MNATSFKMIPGSDELGTIERDLRFHATRNDHPKTLSRSQIDQFNREGYIKGIRVYSPEEIGAIRTYFDGL